METEIRSVLLMFIIGLTNDMSFSDQIYFVLGEKKFVMWADALWRVCLEKVFDESSKINYNRVVHVYWIGLLIINWTLIDWMLDFGFSCWIRILFWAYHKYLNWLVFIKINWAEINWTCLMYYVHAELILSF